MAASGPAAQEPATLFRSGVDLVSLSVVVTDSQGKFVGGLSGDEFAVFEDGVRQGVGFFAATPVPIDLAILLDTSASMTDKIATVQQAAVGFTGSVRPGDRVTIVGIKDAVRILHPLNEDVAAARTAIAGTRAGGNTSLYNALYMTLKEMIKHRRAEGEVRRQAIVVLSDGDDTTSLVGFDDVMALVGQSGVAIYTITLRSPLVVGNLFTPRGSQARSDFSMKELAQETGARAFFPGDIKELAGVYGTIAEELANQYLLGYTSSNSRLDGAYRRVQVRVERPGARTRTRTGYFAPQPAPVAKR
jgi:Ca-activated chloride channel family protein